MSETTKPRVELPVLCKFLRCKSMYGSVVDNAEWQEGTATAEVYWCLATMEAFGPDDGYVHATVCRGTREQARADQPREQARAVQTREQARADQPRSCCRVDE